MKKREKQSLERLYLNTASNMDKWLRDKIGRMESKQIHKIQPYILASNVVKAYKDNYPDDVLSRIENLGYNMTKFQENLICALNSYTSKNGRRSYIARSFWWSKLEELNKEPIEPDDEPIQAVNIENEHTTINTIWQNRWWETYFECWGQKSYSLTKSAEIANKVIETAMEEIDIFFNKKES